MQYTLSTVSAFVAALSLTTAAPTPSYHDSNKDVVIVRQLAGFDAASTITAKLGAVTVNNRDVKSAAVSGAGPWCAGFTDAEATVPAKALNGDGVFDSSNPAVYTNEQNDAVEIGSWWCAATRPEVEDFVARATGGNQGGNDNQTPAAPINNGGSNGGAAATVRVQIELEAGTTFVQNELPANVGIVSASTIAQLSRGVVGITIVSEGGDCDFLDAQGQAINFAQTSGLVNVAAFVCEV